MCQSERFWETFVVVSTYSLDRGLPAVCRAGAHRLKRSLRSFEARPGGR